MADASIFQIFGLAYLAIGFGMYLSPNFYKTMINKMIENEAVLFVTGLLVLVIGGFLVNFHNVWEGGWTIVITIMGWLALIKGAMMVVIPEKSIKLYKSINISEKQMGMYAVIVVALGAVMAYLGYINL